jgi:hypothetical protein
MLKKIVSSLLVLMFVLGNVTPSMAQESNGENKITEKEMKKLEKEQRKLQKEQQKMIKDVEPYVIVTDDGTIKLENAPKNLYKKYDLEKLEAHFEQLNQSALDGSITINEDLTIEDNSFSIAASYSKWTYHWWGYDRKMTNSYAKWYANNYLATIIGGGTVVTGVGAFFPPVGAVAGISTGQWILLQTRINANNKGNGVYVGVTWALFFNVDPL